MLFNSYAFIFIFLPIALLGYYLIATINNKGAITWLTLVSIFFYGYWSIYSLPILMCSICLNYMLATKLADPTFENRKAALILAISINIFALAYFKYVDFFIYNTNILREMFGMVPIDAMNVVLPIGISFFTFTQIAFLIDSYQGKVKERNFTKYALFVTFFPHLIAGPVIHHKQMMPQFSDVKNFTINFEKISYGIILFTIGLAKKILLADTLADYADSLFEGASKGIAPQFFTSWLGSFAYTFQLYFDFSGYSDMAVGLSLLFGIWLPYNFNSPFKAVNIIDFWQRWHISLTKYIGQYMYIPITLRFMRLAQNKSRLFEVCYSLVTPTLLIFLVLGFWHGANWTFIIFGGMHGCFVVCNHMWRYIFPLKSKKVEVTYSSRLLKNSVSWIITFLAVDLAFVMFRSADVSTALTVYEGMIGVNGIVWPKTAAIILGSSIQYGEWMHFPGKSTLQLLVLILFSFGISLLFPSAASLIREGSPERKNLKYLNSSWVQVLIGITFFLCVLGINKTSSFLYFQF